MDTIQTRKKIGFPGKNKWNSFPATFTDKSLEIAGHSVMEKWETNYMKTLAKITTANGGNILEIGFGLGISAKFIQNSKKIKKHTIIEPHPDVVKKCKKMFSKKINIIEGFWEDVVSDLPDNSFDGILFDTYPMSEKEIHKNHFWFFKEAHRLLKKDGILTYYSDECDKFSKNHIRKLKQAGFQKIEFEICEVSPPKDCNYWNKETILAPIVVK